MSYACVACERLTSTHKLAHFTSHPVKREQWIISLSRADPVEMAQLRRRIERRARPMICNYHFPDISEVDEVNRKLRSNGLPVPIDENRWPLSRNISSKFLHRVPQLLIDVTDPIKRQKIIADSVFRPEPSHMAENAVTVSASAQRPEKVLITPSPSDRHAIGMKRPLPSTSRHDSLNGSTSRASEEPVPAKKTSSSRRKTRHVQSRSGSEDEMELEVEKGVVQKEIKSEPLDEDEADHQLFKLSGERVKREQTERIENASVPSVVFGNGKGRERTQSIDADPEGSNSSASPDLDQPFHPSSTPPSSSHSNSNSATNDEPPQSSATASASPYKSALDEIVQTSTTFVVKCPNSFKGLNLKRILKKLGFAYCQYNDLGEEIDNFTTDFPRDDDADLSMLNPSVPLSVSFPPSIPSVPEIVSAAPSSVDVPVSPRVKSPLPPSQSPIRAAQSKYTKKLNSSQSEAKDEYFKKIATTENGEFRLSKPKPFPTVNLLRHRSSISPPLSESDAVKIVSPAVLRKVSVTPPPAFGSTRYPLSSSFVGRPIGSFKPASDSSNDKVIIKAVKSSTFGTMRSHPYSISNKLVTLRPVGKTSSLSLKSSSALDGDFSSASTDRSGLSRIFGLGSATYEPVINASRRLKKIEPKKPIAESSQKPPLASLQRPYEYRDEAKIRIERGKEKVKERVKEREMEKNKESPMKQRTARGQKAVDTKENSDGCAMTRYFIPSATISLLYGAYHSIFSTRQAVPIRTIDEAVQALNENANTREALRFILQYNEDHLYLSQLQPSALGILARTGADVVRYAEGLTSCSNFDEDFDTILERLNLGDDWRWSISWLNRVACPEDEDLSCAETGEWLGRRPSQVERLRRLLQLLYVKTEASLDISSISTDLVSFLYSIYSQFIDSKQDMAILALKILSNVAAQDSRFAKAIFTSDWLPLLSQMTKKGKTLTEQLLSHKICQNALYTLNVLDYKLGPNVYELYLPMEEPVCDIVMIHGLRGSVDYTWRQKDSQSNIISQCWPKDWLPLDIQQPIRIIGIDYPSYLIQFTGTMESLQIRADRFKKQLLEAGLGRRPIIFICHSMGGLLAKRMLIDREDWASRTAGILFIATPHRGSPIAAWSYEFLYPTEDVKFLREKNPLIVKLDEDFEPVSNQLPVIASMVETRPSNLVGTAKGIIVPSNSGVLNRGVVYHIDEMHHNVCKPSERTSPSYGVIINFIKDSVEKAKTLVPKEMSSESTEQKEKPEGGSK
ncbi:hypothetical protein WR25_23569 [Diploscapter pachys]|uniref:GPI inositol-deacylase n=1 Tax=Diploscapter pachys TaxID=2018661 RepID=A0A2A2JF88_9BILA|nr:hypothetical protein WR25_23569 [Diploscapter pachys]